MSAHETQTHRTGRIIDASKIDTQLRDADLAANRWSAEELGRDDAGPDTQSGEDEPHAVVHLSIG
jgi:hypothetical protein